MPVYAENCPQALGITKHNTNEGITLISISRAILLSNSPESIKSSSNEAITNAKLALLKNPYLKQKENNLSGAIKINTCIKNNYIFAIVKISEQSIKIANQMDSLISESLKNTPNFSSIDENQIHSDFEKLINKSIDDSQISQ
jgi:hypothetical protein